LNSHGKFVSDKSGDRGDRGTGGCPWRSREAREGGPAARLRAAKGCRFATRRAQGGLQVSNTLKDYVSDARQDHPPPHQRQLRQAPALGARPPSRARMFALLPYTRAAHVLTQGATHMKVILRESAGLGHSGDLVEVREGYGRNYLLPRKLAVLANEKNLNQLEHDKKVIATRQAKLKAAAGDVAAMLAKTQLKLSRKVGEQEKLFGSVTALDIAEALVAKGMKDDRRRSTCRIRSNLGTFEWT
jgi:large subunit ribosomal protein L9